MRRSFQARVCLEVGGPTTESILLSKSRQENMGVGWWCLWVGMDRMSMERRGWDGGDSESWMETGHSDGWTGRWRDVFELPRLIRWEKFKCTKFMGEVYRYAYIEFDVSTLEIRHPCKYYKQGPLSQPWRVQSRGENIHKNIMKTQVDSTLTDHKKPFLKNHGSRGYSACWFW